MHAARQIHAGPALRPPYAELYREAAAFIPADRLITDPLRLLTWGTDASFYRLVPKLAVVVESEEEVIALLAAARGSDAPVTFRAAGTSLSGQAITDSVLVLLGDDLAQLRDRRRCAARSRCSPASSAREANRRLAALRPQDRPRPGIDQHGKIGGIAANNASGMCCGTAQNSYARWPACASCWPTARCSTRATRRAAPHSSKRRRTAGARLAALAQADTRQRARWPRASGTSSG